jgi:hypothetical protein
MRVNDYINQFLGNPSYHGTIHIGIRAGTLVKLYNEKSEDLNKFEEAEIIETVKLPLTQEESGGDSTLT